MMNVCKVCSKDRVAKKSVIGLTKKFILYLSNVDVMYLKYTLCSKFTNINVYLK